MNKEEKQLEALTKTIDFLQDGKATQDEVAQTFEALVSIIKQLKDQIDQDIANNKDEISSVNSSVLEKINELELRTTQMSNRLEEKMLGDNISIQKQLQEKVNSIKELIPSIPSFQPLMDRILEVERKIPFIPDEISAEKVRDKLETLKDDNRLDISAIKGFGKRIAHLSDEIVNRALSILDQRTSFLINKVSNLQTAVNNLQNSSSTLTSLIVTCTGTIDDSNTSFTFTAIPSVIVVNGASYASTGGAITWTLSGLVATLSSPVGQNGSIFGLK